MQLARTPRIGPVTFFQLIARFGSAGASLRKLPSLSARHQIRKIPSRASIEDEWQSIQALGAQLVCAADRTYPPLLRHLDPPPPVLVAFGKLALAGQRTVAIVGARQASALGRKIAKDISIGLGKSGFVTVSGMARGIDGEAHAASLQSGTIAVLGGGIDHIYPPQHEDLYNAIAQFGLILSESPFGYRATARDFPRRNRIITGLSEAVVIIEAAERSGSLISARTAIDQNREVFAVPGSPMDPRYAGSNRLLRDGAILVRHADDIIDALANYRMQMVRTSPPPPFSPPKTSVEDIPQTQFSAVQNALTFTPMSIDQIASSAEISVARCAAILAELELAGVATTYAGGLASLSAS